MYEAIIDLETMSVKHGAAITAIGIAVFKDRKLHDTFYTKVNLQSSIDLGGRVDGSTIEWWLKQSDAARDEMCQKGQDIVMCLVAVTNFLSQFGGDVRVWGKGAIFDIGNLEAAFEKAGMPFPWKYGNVQCFRTLNDLFPEVPYDPPAVAHHALGDALAEGNHLMKIFDYLDKLRSAYVEKDMAKVLP